MAGFFTMFVCFCHRESWVWGRALLSHIPFVQRSLREAISTSVRLVLGSVRGELHRTWKLCHHDKLMKDRNPADLTEINCSVTTYHTCFGRCLHWTRSSLWRSCNQCFYIWDFCISDYIPVTDWRNRDAHCEQDGIFFIAAGSSLWGICKCLQCWQMTCTVFESLPCIYLWGKRISMNARLKCINTYRRRKNWGEL